MTGNIASDEPDMTRERRSPGGRREPAACHACPHHLL